MQKRARIFIGTLLLLASLGPLLSQEKGISYLVTAGKGGSTGDWGLRYTLAAGIELPLDGGYSLTSSLNYLEYPFYNYGGLARILSHGTKSEISVVGLLKLSAPWSVAPYIAAGLGFAAIKEGEVVKQPLYGGYLVTPSRGRLAFFASKKTGVEIYVLQTLAVGAHLTINIGTYQYSSNFSAQVGIRFWP